MKIKAKQEFKTWGTYFVIILLSVYCHELGHSLAGWIYGYKSVPTPAKEYALEKVPQQIQLYVSMGGALATVLFTLGIFYLFLQRTFAFNSAILAGAIASPGIYTLRFILKGRGHDSTEFQEAQSALGLSYQGHFLDWLFLILFILGIIIWIAKTKPSLHIFGRILFGVILTFFFLSGLQDLNNWIFDPIFQSNSFP